MDDREMLELAAKAAGIEGWYEPAYLTFNAGGKPWRPLEDDGERHRLQVDLKMTVAHEPCRGGWSAGAVVGGEFRWLAFDEREPYAITRAAAEIGKAMK